MRRILFLAVLSLAVALSAPAAESMNREQKIRKLLELTNAPQMGMQVMDQMIDGMKGTMPQVPAEFWTSFRSKFTGQELVDLLVPIYLRNLEDMEVDAAIAFFSSPGGQRFIAKQPAIAMESMQAGQKWGEEIAMKALSELQASQPNQ